MLTATRQRASASEARLIHLSWLLTLLGKQKAETDLASAFYFTGLSACQFLELEARAELHLERNARIVADDEIAAGVSQLSEVRVGRHAETAARRG
jgi:hypothetical protein